MGQNAWCNELVATISQWQRSSVVTDGIQQALNRSQVFEYGGQCREEVWPWQLANTCSMPKSLQQHQGLPPLQLQDIMTGGKSLGAFSLSMWLQFHIKWQVSSGGRDWKAEPQKFSVCFVAGDFYASWGPSWFCFHWSRFLPPGFLCQNNGFLLSSSEFTTITQNAETKKKPCMARLNGQA